jgi:hypothetical protein
MFSDPEAEAIAKQILNDGGNLSEAVCDALIAQHSESAVKRAIAQFKIALAAILTDPAE